MEENGELAHEKSIEPISSDGCAHGHRHADQSHHQISHRKVHQKVVGYTAINQTSGKSVTVMVSIIDLILLNCAQYDWISIV